MKKIFIGLTLLISMCSFAKTYPVADTEGVKILFSKTTGNQEESSSMANIELQDKCRRGSLIGPKKDFYDDYNNGHNWISIQVCSSPELSTQIDVEKERIVLMVVKLGSGEKKSNQKLTERCEELDGELVGKKVLIQTSQYNGSVYLSGQICKY